MVSRSRCGSSLDVWTRWRRFVLSRRIVLLFRQSGQNDGCWMNWDGQRDRNGTLLFAVIMLRWLSGISGSLFVMMTVSMSVSVSVSVSVSSSVFLLDIGGFQCELILFFLFFFSVDIFTMFSVKSGSVRFLIFFFLFFLLFFTFNSFDDGHTIFGYFGGRFTLDCCGSYCC